jgi:hypothetical protein
MHLSSILGFLATASLLGSAAATCFPANGATWAQAGGKVAATNSLSNVCEKLKGPYKKNQERSTCVSKREGTRFDFIIKNISGDRNRRLTVEECKTGLFKEVDNCATGGHTKRDDWEFTYVFDPLSCSWLG